MGAYRIKEALSMRFDKVSAIAPWLICTLGLAAVVPLEGAAGAKPLTFYASRAAFEAAEPGLPVQSFNSANLHGQPYQVIANGLNSQTSDGVFQAGDILGGLAIDTRHPGQQSTALIVTSSGPPNAVSVGDNWFGDTLRLEFSPGVGAVGETVFASTSNGPSFAGKIHEAVYSGSKLLGGRTVSEATGGDVFIGVASSGPPITRVEITWASDGDATTYVSDVAFGAAKP